MSKKGLLGRCLPTAKRLGASAPLVAAAALAAHNSARAQTTNLQAVTVYASGIVTALDHGGNGVTNGSTFSCSLIVDPKELVRVQGYGTNVGSSGYVSTNKVHVVLNGVSTNYDGYFVGVCNAPAGDGLPAENFFVIDWGPNGSGSDGIAADYPISTGADSSITTAMNMLNLGLSGAYPGETGFSANYDEWGNAGAYGPLSSLFVNGPTLKIGPCGDSQVAVSYPTNNSQCFVLQQSSTLGGQWTTVTDAPQVGTAYTYLGSKGAVDLSLNPGGTNLTYLLDKPATIGFYRLWNTNFPDVK